MVLASLGVSQNPAVRLEPEVKQLGVHQMAEPPGRRLVPRTRGAGARVSALAPELVVTAFAMVAILVTGGIVYVLASEAQGFYRGVACGHQEPELPGHWSAGMNEAIFATADRDGLCIDGWDGAAMIDLETPVLGAAWTEGRTSVPLSELEANEPALHLAHREDGVARGWFVVTWAWDEGADGLDAGAVVLLALTLLVLLPLLAPRRAPDVMLAWLHDPSRRSRVATLGSASGAWLLVGWIASGLLGLPAWMMVLLAAVLAGLGLARTRGLVWSAQGAHERGAVAALAIVFASLPFVREAGLSVLVLAASIVLFASGLQQPWLLGGAAERRASFEQGATGGGRRGLTIGLTAITLLLLFLAVTTRIDGAIGEFLFQTDWETTAHGEDARGLSPSMRFGVNALLSATMKVAFGALLIAVPLGIASAVYMSEYAAPRVRAWLKPTIELLAGVPSVVYGFFAIIVLAPISVDVGTWLFEAGWIDAPPDPMNTVTAGIVVGIMILPLVASLSEDALRAVPRDLREASLALGATRLETTSRVVIPAGLSGIVASVILALSRAVGETMAVTLAVGTIAAYTGNPFVSSQTMTSFIAQKVQGEASKGTLAYSTVFGVGFYLFVLTLGLNLLGNRILARFREVVD